MKSQAHLPISGIEESHWNGAKIVLASLVGAVAIVAMIESGVLLNNPLIDSLRMSSVEDRQISGAHRVSLDVQLLSYSSDQLRRFSVAHALPVEVTTSQRYSIGGDARVRFEIYGDAALRDLSKKKPTPKIERSNNRMMLMLMLARLRTHRF